MEAKTINLQEWESFGGGGFGETFFNRKDDSVILKLNKPSVTEEKARIEFLRSKDSPVILPYLQGKKLLKAFNLFIRDRK